MTDASHVHPSQHPDIRTSEFEQVDASCCKRFSGGIPRSVYGFRTVEHLHLRQPLLHGLHLLSRREDGATHPMTSHPALHPVVMARPAIPDKRHHLVREVIGEGIETDRHRLHEHQPGFPPRTPQFGPFASVCQRVEQTWRKERTCRPSTQRFPRLVRSRFEIDAAGMTVGGYGFEICHKRFATRQAFEPLPNAKDKMSALPLSLVMIR